MEVRETAVSDLFEDTHPIKKLRHNRPENSRRVKKSPPVRLTVRVEPLRRPDLIYLDRHRIYVQREGQDALERTFQLI